MYVLESFFGYSMHAKTPYAVFYIKVLRRLKVSCEIALKQLNGYLDGQNLDKAHYANEFKARAARYDSWRDTLRSLESPSDDGIVTVPYLTSRLRELVPQDTTFVLEAVTNAGHLIHHLNLTKVCPIPNSPLNTTDGIKPGTLFGSGAGGLGWGGGAALGVKLAKPYTFICAM